MTVKLYCCCGNGTAKEKSDVIEKRIAKSIHYNHKGYN
jgi:hypothetical protein